LVRAVIRDKGFNFPQSDSKRVSALPLEADIELRLVKRSACDPKQPFTDLLVYG